MECAVAIQVLPMDAATDEEVCRIVDEVIAYLQSLPVNTFVGPFETTIEGDYDTCLDALKQAQLIAARAGSEKICTYAKIEYKPAGITLTTERKIGKYRASNAASGLGA
ncbi:thiamine-binding protein [Eggerthellaceae bacterium zg-887]|uniref:thiamine-binding protein n=1 Tax=Xiamenia xianingshaonis TaxID=2682776 RepID=UPI0013EC9DCC|nr:thiamine-binding protein [Xiamenia xianingshaonis]NGM18258.1 thiamine-binding protein [Eggerthellaceae bacterium zg-893]NHM15746.1 thiamine-binding protein [Xiamenia xianingshaonis]